MLIILNFDMQFLFLSDSDMNFMYNVLSMAGFLMKIKHSFLGICMILDTSLSPKHQSILIMHTIV